MLNILIDYLPKSLSKTKSDLWYKSCSGTQYTDMSRSISRAINRVGSMSLSVSKSGYRVRSTSGTSESNH